MKLPDSIPSVAAGKCRACGAVVLVARTVHGFVVLDAAPSAQGSLRVHRGYLRPVPPEGLREARLAGGLYAVLPIAYGSGADTGFVLAVQGIRLFAMVLAAPAMVRWLVRKDAAKRCEEPGFTEHMTGHSAARNHQMHGGPPRTAG